MNAFLVHFQLWSPFKQGAPVDQSEKPTSGLKRAPKYISLPRPPNVPLLMALWSLLDGI